MDKRISDLQEVLIATCIDHDFPEIMAALTMVQAATGGIRLAVQLQFSPSEVH